MNLTRRAFVRGCGCMAASSFLAPAVAWSRGEVTFEGRICAFGPSPVFGTVANVGSPSEEAIKVVDWITEAVGIRQNFEIVAADIERYATAFATVRQGQRYIVYNREEFGWKDSRASYRDYRIMAHEVAHHLASHSFADEYSQHEQELEADRFSGFALSKLGASLEQTTSGLWDWPGTQWHPGGGLRKKAVEAGWHQGEKIKERESSVCVSSLGGELDVSGSECRIVRVCGKSQRSTRLACKDYDDRWRWVR